MAAQRGDVVRFDYTLRVDGKVLETSDAEAAQKEGILDAERRYRPMTVTLGAQQIIPGLDKALLAKAEAGGTFRIKIPPEDAYGARDAGNLKDVPMAKFREQKVKPEVGMRINYEGQAATVVRVAGGRVRVDTNHRLAGKTLDYEVHVRDVLADADGKVKATLENMFGPGGCTYEMGDDRLEVVVPDQAKFDQNWPMAKFRVLADLRAAAGPRTIRLVEEYPPMPAAGGGAADDPHAGHDHGPAGEEE